MKHNRQRIFNYLQIRDTVFLNVSVCIILYTGRGGVCPSMHLGRGCMCGKGCVCVCGQREDVWRGVDENL